MKFQLPKNDPINRDDEGRLELKKAIIEIWLRVWVWNKMRQMRHYFLHDYLTLTLQ